MVDWKNIVGSVAPMLGGALGGPLGAAAVGIVADALGLSDKTEDGIKQALNGGAATPEALLALKVAEQDFAVRMQELGFANAKDMEALAAGDRDSARKREMVVKDHTARNLAYIVTLGYFASMATLVFGVVPTESKDILLGMVGTLGTVWVGVMAYYYGTTASSRLKTELLAKAQPITE